MVLMKLAYGAYRILQLLPWAQSRAYPITTGSGAEPTGTDIRVNPVSSFPFFLWATKLCFLEQFAVRIFSCNSWKR